MSARLDLPVKMNLTQMRVRRFELMDLLEDFEPDPLRLASGWDVKAAAFSEAIGNKTDLDKIADENGVSRFTARTWVNSVYRSLRLFNEYR